MPEARGQGPDARGQRPEASEKRRTTGQRVIVIGAGISGLAAAYDLSRAGIPTTVFDKQARAGGVIDTRLAEGCTLECGPDSFLSAKPEAVALIKELGFGDEVIGSNDHQRTTYIVKRGRLVPLPDGVMMIVPSRVMPMVKTSLVGMSTKIRMGLEYFRKPQISQVGRRQEQSKDRSVADFVTDHFGAETLDYLAEPLLSGVYGGDPAQLSVASILPRFVEMEKKYGSLVRGVLESRRANARPGAAPAPLFQTLKSGLGKLVDALASRAEIVHAGVEAIEREDSAFRVRVNGEWLLADHVVLACPAWAAGQLVKGVDGKLAELLESIDYSSSVTLSLIYRAGDFDGRNAGFGFLVPKKERHRLAACTFVGTKFSYRIPEDKIALRCFFGGIGDAAILNESDDTVIAIARQELQRILGLRAEPVEHVIARWPRSMAQYNVGHGPKVREIRERAAALGGIYLAGNAYEGIGISDCIRTGRAAAKAIVAGSQ